MSVIISSEEKESPATASTENGLWVLKCYDPRRQGSGYGFAQQRLQAMLQIEAERHAYSRIAAMTKAEEGGTQFLMWMGASLTIQDSGYFGI